jgi:ABC-type phosphate transport system substrate-binding protein
MVRSSFIAIGLALHLAGSAMADVVAVVSAKSAHTTLTKNQVADIFLGKTVHFPDGTLALPIDQEEGSLSRSEFYATFAGKSQTQLKSHWTKIIFTGRGQPPKALSDGAAVRSFTAANPQAIGYMERSAVDSQVRVVVQP